MSFVFLKTRDYELHMYTMTVTSLLTFWKISLAFVELLGVRSVTVISFRVITRDFIDCDSFLTYDLWRQGL